MTVTQIFFEAFAPVRLKRRVNDMAELPMLRTPSFHGLSLISAANLAAVLTMIGVVVAVLIAPQIKTLSQSRDALCAGESDPSIDPFIVESINPSILRSFDPLIHRSIDPSIRRSIDQSIRRSIDPSIHPSFDPSIDPSIFRSVDRSIHLSIHPSFDPSMHRSIH